MAIKVLKGYR
jgi:hypothetical protein